MTRHRLYGLVAKRIQRCDFLDMNFCWDLGIFEVLGIKFSTDTAQISPILINFEGKISEIIKILNNWSRGHITPLGKITVVKTLVLPKLIQLFVNLPDLSGDFLKELGNILFSSLISMGREAKVILVKKILSVNCKKMED